MKKRMLALLMIGIMCFSMSACKKVVQTSEESPSENVDITPVDEKEDTFKENEPENEENVTGNETKEPVDQVNTEVQEPTGNAYHSNVKKSRDTIFYAYEEEILKVNMVSNDLKKLYTVDSKEKQVSSFTLHNDTIYFIVSDYTEPTIKVVLYRMDMDGENLKEIKEVPEATSLFAYEDILYVDSYYGEHSCYPIDALGNLGEKLEDQDTYYRYLNNMNTNDLQNVTRYSISECMSRYGAIWVKDQSGKVYCIDPATGDRKAYDTIGQYFIEVQGSYMITNEYTDGGTTYYLWDLTTNEYSEFLKGDVSYLDVDEEGMYYYIVNYETYEYQYKYITWDGTIKDLFKVSPVTGYRDRTVMGVRNFSVIDGRIYYQFGTENGVYLMYRDINRIDEEHRIGTAITSEPYSKYGIVECDHQEIMSKKYPDKLVKDILVESFVFHDDSDAMKNLNEMFKEIKDASIQAEIDEVEDIDEWITEEDVAYSFESTVDGITELSERYILLNTSGYIFSGGAHGLPLVDYYLLDLKEGRRLLLEDVIDNSEEELQNIVSKYFELMYHENPDRYFEQAIEYVKEINMSQTFYLDKEGIVFVYYPYDLNAYAFGFTEIHIPYREFKLKIEL